MREQEFNIGDIIHKPHERYKKVFVPLKVTGVSWTFFGDEITYKCHSMDPSFSWVVTTEPTFIKESKYFGDFSEGDLIDKEYQAWIEQLAKGGKHESDKAHGAVPVTSIEVDRS